MVLVLSLPRLTTLFEFGMHVPATQSLDRSKDIPFASHQLHSLPMVPALFLAHGIRLCEYGMLALARPLLDRSRGIGVGSIRLHFLPTARALFLARKTKQSE